MYLKQILPLILILLIFISDLLDTLEDILPSLQEDNILVWAMKKETSYPGVNTLIDKMEEASDKPVPAELRAITSLKSPNLYIFTSGTTGAFVALSQLLYLITCKASISV